jgi:hypothetical protein
MPKAPSRARPRTPLRALARLPNLSNNRTFRDQEHRQLKLKNSIPIFRSQQHR